MAILRFAFTVDGEVSHVMEIDDTFEHTSVPRIISALRSEPIFVEVDNDEIGYGWTYDGTDFYPPVE